MPAMCGSSTLIFLCCPIRTARSRGPTTRSRTTTGASSAPCMSWTATARSPARGEASPRSTRLSPVPPDFHGKVALVTGVGRVGQIGHAVASGLGRAGAQLVIADVNAAGLADRAKEFGSEGFAVHPVAGDLTTPDVARRVVAAAGERYGGLDLVVNVAGGLVSFGPATELTPERPGPELALHGKSAVYGCQ